MNKSSKIYIAGHTGLVGSAITTILKEKGYNNLIFKNQAELDLANQMDVDAFFATEKPDYVFLAAALVGGIVANNKYRADFIYQNIMIQSNVIYSSWKYGVKKLLFLGSTCIYPKNAPQPMRESSLLTSPLENTNEPYAVAKIAGLKMCESFNIQYKTNFISVMPTNLYGPGDNFNLEKSHVLPALMRKIHLGKCLENGDWEAIRKDLNKYPIRDINGNSDIARMKRILQEFGVIELDESTADKDHGLKSVAVTVWGTGNPMREFMYSKDMAEACVYIMEKVDINYIIELNRSGRPEESNHPHFLNIGTGEEISIKDLANKMKRMIGFKGEISFDKSKPDGPARKASDITLLKRIGYSHKLNLDAGLKVTYSYYLDS
jgi:GDP-L-fucose synthase